MPEITTQDVVNYIKGISVLERPGCLFGGQIDRLGN